MTKLLQSELRIAIAAAVLLSGITGYLVFALGLAALILVSIPAFFAYVFWLFFYLKTPTQPSVVLAPFLVMVAGFGFHVIEQYLGHYGPAVGRLFGFAWTTEVFVIIVVPLLGGLCLVAIGLYYRVAMAGLVAIVFMMTRLAEVALFVFPLIPPVVEPDNPDPVSALVSGTMVSEMPSYYIGATGSYYFPGLYSILLPILPALVSLWVVWRFSWASRKQANHR